MAYIDKLDKDITGIAFLDELHTDLGASAYTLNHDYFWGNSDLEIWTGAGKTGTRLTEGAGNDYTIGGDTTTRAIGLTTESGKTVYGNVTIGNATYQTGNLYFNGYYLGDDNQWDDVNYRIRNTKALAVNAAYSILATDRYNMYRVTTGETYIPITLPPVADVADQIFKIRKEDTGYGCVKLIPDGAETINDIALIFLFNKGDTVEIESNGTEWFIVNSFKPYFESGWINRSDWTNVHLGFLQVTFAVVAGTILVGEKITGTASATKAIVIDNTGGVLTVVNVSGGTNNFTNAETITGGTSGATGTVSAGTKNVDSNILHNWGVEIQKINSAMHYKDIVNSDVFQLYPASVGYSSNIQGQNFGLQMQDDAGSVDQIVLQAGTSGVILLSEAGSYSARVTDDDAYRIYIEVQ